MSLRILCVTDGERQTSPSLFTGDDDDGSSDSYSPDGDIIDALCLAQDKNLINCALDTVAKVVGEVWSFNLHTRHTCTHKSVV